METDTDANVFVAYLFEDKVQTIFVQQADVRLIEDLDDVTIIYTLKFHPHFIKRQSLIDDFYNTLFVSSPMNIGRFVNGTPLCDSPFLVPLKACR
jgi:hypothetical protein